VSWFFATDREVRLFSVLRVLEMDPRSLLYDRSRLFIGTAVFCGLLTPSPVRLLFERSSLVRERMVHEALCLTESCWRVGGYLSLVRLLRPFGYGPVEAIPRQVQFLQARGVRVGRRIFPKVKLVSQSLAQ